MKRALIATAADEWGVPCCDKCFCAYEDTAFALVEIAERMPR